MSPEDAKTLQEPTAADLVDRLVQFDGPPQEFLTYLLAVQCRLAAAQGGVILRAGGENELQILNVYPPPQPNMPAPPWISQAAEAAPAVLQGGKSVIVPVHSSTDMYGAAPHQFLILVPIKHTGRTDVRGASAFLVEPRDADQLRDAQERLELSVSLLSLYEMQLMMQRRQLDMRRLRDALEVLAAVNRHDRMGAYGMALCNEFAARWSCQRVSLGFVRGRGIELAAISHTENFARKMQLVQDLEAAQEECLDQDVEILAPAPPDATYVSRAAGILSQRHGPAEVCSIPLRHAGKVQAVLTVERAKEQTFDLATLEALRLTADLVSPRMVDLHEHDRWVGAKLAQGMRKLGAAAVGPKHTWIKLLAVGICAFIVFLIVGKGMYTVESPFTLQALEHQVVPAPSDNILETVEVDLGQEVKKGQVLARLDTDQLQLQLAAVKADKAAAMKEYDKSLRDEKQPEAQIAKAQADKAQAQMDLLEDHIRRATLVAPIDGWVVTGDLKRNVGLAVKTGDVLFEVAPVQNLRAELAVDEREIHEIRTGASGKLATPGHPEERLAFQVETINPIAESTESKNVFKVRVKIVDARPWMRPGMEGIAHVDVESRHYAWIWAHTAVNWIRLKLWI